MMNDETKDEILAKTKIQKWCETKRDKITNSLLEFFDSHKSKLNKMNVYPIISNILSTDNKIMKLKDRQFDNAEDVEYCFDAFKEIMSTINLQVVYVPDQQNFCMFMGWTDRVYKRMLDSPIEEVSDMMQLVNEYIIACQLSAGQMGIAKANLTKFRSQLAGEHGQNLVTQKEQNEENRSSRKMKTREQLLKELINQGSKIPASENAEKLLKGKK